METSVFGVNNKFEERAKLHTLGFLNIISNFLGMITENAVKDISFIFNQVKVVISNVLESA